MKNQIRGLIKGVHGKFVHSRQFLLPLIEHIIMAVLEALFLFHPFEVINE
jgi:hypothetical protein